MGTIAYQTIAGVEIELSDHEGYVLHESTVPNRYIAEWGNWLGYYSSEVSGTFTGRHVAACDCGWRGPVITDTERTTDMSALTSSTVLLRAPSNLSAPPRSADFAPPAE